MGDSKSVDLQTKRSGSLLRTTVVVVVCVLMLAAVVGAGVSFSSPSQQSPSSNDSQSAPGQVSDETGISQGKVSGAVSIIDRYGLDNAARNQIVKDAGYMYSLESTEKYGAVLKHAGVGDLNDIADRLAHLAKEWEVKDSDVAHSDEGIFNALIQFPISWDELTNTLTANGAKMRDYISLFDAALQLGAVHKSFDSEQATTMFNVVGDALADPNSKLNLELGGSGYIRHVVQTSDNGLIAAMEKIHDYIVAHE